MSRPLKCRRICNPPKMQGFKPFGMYSSAAMTVKLKMEEYESMRLVNYDMLPQEDAAARMNVSRPTFTRIYNNALKQIAKSFVDGLPIEIEGGNFELQNEWYRCRKCFRLIEGAGNHSKCRNCPDFSDNELIRIK